MATEKEFRLIGSFQDNITSKLKKLNREINTINKSFGKMQAKLRPIARDMGTVAMASDRVTTALKAQKTGYQSSISTMRTYRSEMGKVIAANKKASSMKPPKLPAMPTSRAPRALMGGVTPMRGGGGSAAAGVTGGVLGVGLGSMMTEAIIKGFDIGKDLMIKPFIFMKNALGERIADEMSDIRAAGGLFSIAQRMDTPFVKTFADAEELTKETNRYLAELAGALPGDTQEYINISKQISDGIYTVISNDKENAVQLGKELAQARGADMSDFEKGGTSALKAAGKEMVGEMTKLTVLAGMGGNQGAFGLPQLVEQMIAKDKVTLKSFSKYAAIFRDPMIKGALERNIEKINASGKNTTERYKALQETLEEIVTPELVRRYQRSTEGIIESLKSTFTNPEVGILGLGRPLSIASQSFNEFGEKLYTLQKDVTVNGKTIEKGTKVTARALKGMKESLEEVAVAATDNLSIFDYVRDVFANVFIALEPVINAATKLFDPFMALGKILDGLRNATMGFQRSFEQYTQWFKDQGNKFDAATIPLRGSLSAIVEALYNMGALTKKEVDKFVADIKDPKAGMAKFGKMIQDLLNKFLNSDAARKVGDAIGKVIGTVLATVGNMVAGVAGNAKSGPLIEGFQAGFAAAGGPKAIRDIITGVFDMLGKFLIEIFKAAPLQVSMLAGLALLPSIISAGISGLVTRMIESIEGMIPKAPSMGGLKSFGKGAVKGGAGIQGPMPTPAGTKGMMAGGKLNKAFTGFVNNVKGTGPRIAHLGQEARVATQMLNAGQFGAVAKGVLTPLKAMGPALKAVGAKVPLIGGVITAIISLFEGKSILDAFSAGLGSAGGTAIGAAIGSIILPGIGTVIGGVIGGWVGTLKPVTDLFKGIIMGFGEAFKAIWVTLGPIFEGLGTALADLFSVGMSVVNMFNPFAGQIEEAMSGFDMLKAVVIAVKVVLTPVVAAFQLLEQVVNLVVIVIKGLKAAFIGAQIGLSKLNPFANRERQAQLQAEFDAANQEAKDAAGLFKASFERHQEYYKTNLEAGEAIKAPTQSLTKFSDAAAKAGSTFENNKMFEEGGKKFGWAMLNGQKVMVEWGKVAGTSMEKVAKSAGETAKGLDKVKKAAATTATANVNVESSVDVTATNVEEVQLNTTSWWGSFKASVTSAWSNFVNFFTQTIPDWFSKTLKQAVSSMSQAWTQIRNFFGTTIPNAFSSAISFLTNSIKTVWEGLNKFLFDDVPYAIGYAVGFTIQSIKNTWDGLVKFFTTTIPNAFRSAVNTLTTGIKTVWDGLNKFLFDDVPYAIGYAVGFTIQSINNTWNGLVKFFTVTIPNAFRSAISTLTNGVKTIWDGLTKFLFDDVPYAIGYAVGFTIQSIKNTWDSLVKFITVTIPNAWNTSINFLVNTAKSIWTAVTTFFAQTIPNAWDTSINFLVNTATSIWTAVTTFFTKTIPNAWNASINFLVNTATSVWTAITTFFTQTIPNAWNTSINFLVNTATSTWNAITTFFTQTIPNAWSTSINFLVNTAKSIWTAITTFFTVTIPKAWSSAISFVVRFVGKAWTKLVKLVISLPGMLSSAWSGFTGWLANLGVTVLTAVTGFVTKVANVGVNLVTGLGNIVTGIIDWVKNLPRRIFNSLTSGISAGQKTATPQAESNYMGNVIASYKGFNAEAAYRGSLMGAVATEMKYKPPGSNLVIANSSETIRTVKQEAALQARSGHTINIGDIHISGVSDSEDAANQIATQILNAIASSETSTIA